MKEIKVYTQEVADIADKNVEGFNHTFLCFKTIFNILNSKGVFAKALGELTDFEIDYIEQITLETFKYGIVDEYDENIYPSVDLIIGFTDITTKNKTKYCFTVTPFNAYFNNENKNSKTLGACDWHLTKIWRTVMNGFYEEKWKTPFEEYCISVQDITGYDVNTRDGFESIEKVLKSDNCEDTI